MIRMARILGFMFLSLIATTTQTQTGKISAAEAKNHIGEKVTVCGKVVSARFAKDSKGQPTFLNLDEPYPNHIFTIVIWGSNRDKFGNVEAKYRIKDVCVTGKIASYQGKPEIDVNDPSQIEIQK